MIISLPHLVVVWIVGRCNLHATGAHLGLGPFVGHQRNVAVDERQPDFAPGEGHIAQQHQVRQHCLAAQSQLVELGLHVGLLFLARLSQLRAQLGLDLIECRGRIGMHRYRRVAEHRLGARRGDRHEEVGLI